MKTYYTSFEQIRDKFTHYTPVDDERLKIIYDKVLEVSNIPGDMAEIGVYKGGSAFIICNANPDKLLYACDSFEGLPEPDSAIDVHKHLDFNDVKYEEVKDFLNLDNVNLIKAFFPNKMVHEDMFNTKYSFVHLDVDLYKGTLECLEFFYGRLNSGAILISDDYNLPTCPGVKKAFDEFFKDKPEDIIDSGKFSCWFRKL